MDTELRIPAHSDRHERTPEEGTAEIDDLETSSDQKESNASDNESIASGCSDDSEMEPFSDYLPKIEQLLSNIGLDGFIAEPLQHGYTFQNCVYALKNPHNDEEQYILRVPICPLDVNGKVVAIENDAALLGHLADKLPVPRVKAYSTTNDNALNTAYTVQTRLPGQSLDDFWDDMSHEEKLRIVDQFVELLAKIESVTFATAGTFTASPLPTIVSDFVTTATPSISTFVQGDEEFVKDPEVLQDRAGPDVKSLLVSHINGWISRDSKTDIGPFTLPRYNELLAIIDELDNEGTFSDGPSPVVLHHWDLEPRNIMVEKRDGTWKICGVIDLDDTLALPRPLARRAPDWIWDFNCEGFTGYLDNDHHPNNKLSEEQLALKAYFDTKAAAALPGYLEDTYGRGLWLRRIWTFARAGAGSQWYVELIRSMQPDWDARTKPITPEPRESSMSEPEEVVEPAFEQPLAPEVEEPTVLEPEKPKNLWRKSIGWLSLRVKALRA